VRCWRRDVRGRPYDAREDPLDAPRAPAEHARHFPNLADYRQTATGTGHQPPATGHNLPHEDPAGFADAIRALRVL
jgi:pimeloyl-ACP methyl ester carboxylesterase